MSRENVEVVHKFIQAWNERDAETLAALTHPEGEIVLPRNLLEGGSYRGIEGARRALADALETWEEVTVGIETIRDRGDQVVVLARTVNVPRREGPRTEYEAGYVMTVRDGKLLQLRPFMSHGEALEAVGLRE
jgi:ketosteroid isomerase-like protein